MASSGMKDGAVQYQEYQCRMEHASLGQPGLYSWEPRPNLIPVVAGGAVVILIAGIVGFVVWKRKGQQGYRAAPGLDRGSGGSAAGSERST
ncbi:class I histocompatibility antigen, F10 alpha chain-like [Numida meleagris]|uniref:class I histocompatibility antigen, F10 alpha chain-like n=1 Tax=Numida meleagris TaxID=8996 RepID=UPI000B3E1222|nr:class I histocompatibility antigen, F10 alpha chain-like [Numida meleagris]